MYPFDVSWCIYMYLYCIKDDWINIYIYNYIQYNIAWVPSQVTRSTNSSNSIHCVFFLSSWSRPRSTLTSNSCRKIKSLVILVQLGSCGKLNLKSHVQTKQNRRKQPEKRLIDSGFWWLLACSVYLKVVAVQPAEHPCLFTFVAFFFWWVRTSIDHLRATLPTLFDDPRKTSNQTISSYQFRPLRSCWMVFISF